MPNKLVEVVRATMTDTSSELKIQNEVTDIIVTRQGLKQGCGLAALLFSLAMGYVVRKVNIGTNDTISYKSSQIMDIVRI
jgi:hypothetical protein